jgi:chemotaxis signal transduction protein
LGNVVVSVADEFFALELGEVREVARGCWPLPLGRAPFGCLGAVSVRGERMPLLDLGVLLGARAPRRGEALESELLRAHLVVLGSEPPLALLVDRVVEVSAEPVQAGAARPLAGADLLGGARRRMVHAAVARLGAAA